MSDGFARTYCLAKRLGDRGVYCGPDGLFVGTAPLLERNAQAPRFAPRPLAVINRDLEACYGLRVDLARKMAGFGAVARALDDGDLARACIAAVFLRLPEIPEETPQAFAKCALSLAEEGLLRFSADEVERVLLSKFSTRLGKLDSNDLAPSLEESSLLKASPDDPEHPGYPAGAPEGKGGQFRPKSGFPVDLTEEEGGAHGGHAIGKHVGRSPQSLLRATESSRITIFGKAYWEDRIGSFPSLAAANKLVNSTLAQNASIVEDVATGKVEAATIESWFKSPTGYESYKQRFESQATIRDTFGVRVRLKHDSRSIRGFRIFTAFPINRED